MKIRINESELRKMIKVSLLKEAKVNLTDRKVVNQNRLVGDFGQSIEDSEENKYVDRIPIYIVEVSNFQDEGTFDRFYLYAKDRIVLGNPDDPKPGQGIRLFQHDLNNKINQLYGLSKHADTTIESRGTGNDPFPYTYGAPIDRTSAIPVKCPFVFSNMDGLVVPKDDNDPMLQAFDRYQGNEAEKWDFATAHDYDNKIIFFFGEMGEKNNFVRQLKNMYMIARHVNKNGVFAYRFDTTHDNQQLKIVEHTRENPLNFLDEWDSDIREKIEAIMERQREIVNKKAVAKQSFEQPEITDNPVGMEDIPSSVVSQGEQNFEDDPEVNQFQDDVFMTDGTKIPTSMAQRTKRITESQLRKMVRKILKEMIE